MNNTTLEVLSVTAGLIAASAAVLKLLKKDNTKETTNIVSQKDNNNSPIQQAGDGATQIINNYVPIPLSQEENVLSKITVQEICEDVNGRPPLQRNSIAKHYIDQVVIWKGAMLGLEEVTHFRKNNGALPYIKGHFRVGEASMYSYFAAIDIKHKKCLEIVKTGAVFVIRGRIDSVQSNYVELDNCEILSINDDAIEKEIEK